MSPLADERPLEDRYRDDGNLSEEAARLSLGSRTGPKRPVPAHVPARRLPGEMQNTTGIAREMLGPTRRRIALAAGAVVVVVLAAVAYVVFQ